MILMTQTLTKQKQRKVLIVEDEALLLEMYEVAFRAGRFNVVIADSGEEGWQQLKRTDADLVLLDIKMDDVSGIEILRRLHNEPHLPKIPVWMLTNVGEEAVAREAMSLGAEEYIMKTKITPSELVAKVKQRLSHRQISTKSKKA